MPRPTTPARRPPAGEPSPPSGRKTDGRSRGAHFAGTPARRPPAGERRHPPAGRPMGVAEALISGARGRAPQRCREPGLLDAPWVPRQPLPGDPPSVAPRGRLAPRLNRGIPASRGPPALAVQLPARRYPAGPAIEGTARTSDDALPAPVPGRVRTMSPPEMVRPFTVKPGRRK